MIREARGKEGKVPGVIERATMRKTDTPAAVAWIAGPPGRRRETRVLRCWGKVRKRSGIG